MSVKLVHDNTYILAILISAKYYLINEFKFFIQLNLFATLF
jgi:hypothetical protein